MGCVITMTQEPIYYDSMFAYAANADISHYRCNNVDRDAPPIIVGAFRPFDDPGFAVFGDDEIEKDGKTYVWICWGDGESAYLAEDMLYAFVYVKYKLCDTAWEYVSDGRVYETAMLEV